MYNRIGISDHDDEDDDRFDFFPSLLMCYFLAACTQNNMLQIIAHHI